MKPRSHALLARGSESLSFRRVVSREESRMIQVSSWGSWFLLLEDVKIRRQLGKLDNLVKYQ